MKEAGIGDRIKLARADRNLTLSDLARLSGLSKSWLCEIEQGRHGSPGSEALCALSRALEVSTDWLLGLSADSPGATDEKEARIRELLQENAALREWKRRARAWYEAAQAALED